MLFRSINPLFRVIGFQAVEQELSARRGLSAEQLNRRRTAFVYQFIQMMLSRTPRMLRPYNQPSSNSSSTPSDQDFAANPTLRYEVVGVPGTTQTPATVSVEEIRRALDNYITNRANLKRARSLLVRKIVEQQQTINSQRQQARQAQNRAEAQQIQGETVTANTSEPNTTDQERAIAGYEQQIAAFDANFDAVPAHNTTEEYAQQYQTLNNIVNSLERDTRSQYRLQPQNSAPSTGVNDTVLMSFLIGQFRPSGPESGDTVTDPSGTTNQSATLLEQLSDRKASLSLTVPGYYRYYSASHPTPDMQGYEEITPPGSTTNRGTTTTTGSNTSSPGADPSGLTPIVRRTGRDIFRAGGYLTGPRRDVDREVTRMTPAEAAGFLAQAWRRVIRSPPLNRSILEILLAQWSHETARVDPC